MGTEKIRCARCDENYGNIEEYQLPDGAQSLCEDCANARCGTRMLRTDLDYAMPDAATKERKANAILIAAAPDLLEACLQAASAISTTHGAFETIRNAIAKALGQ